MAPRTEAVSVKTLPGSLPRIPIADDVDHAAIATSLLKDLTSISAESFTKDALWRDLYALTGTLRTFYESDKIYAAWKELVTRRKPFNFTLVPKSSTVARFPFDPQIGWIQAAFTFETDGQRASTCSGVIGIVPDDTKGWKIWVISTLLEQVKDFNNVDVLEPQPAKSVANGINGHADAPRHLSNGTMSGINGAIQPQSSFDCVVVGAGMAGLSLAGRLKALGVSYVTLEKNDHIGENWTQRYESVSLHTAKEYAQLPFGRTFGPEDPYFLRRDDIARGFQKYTKMYDINVWLSTVLESASWNDYHNAWTLNINRQGKKSTIVTRHLVLATGPGGQVPKKPTYPNRDQFHGRVIHSKEFMSAKQWKGHKGVVIGTGSTGHDVAQDMLDAGLTSVTMVQRARTTVLPTEYYRAVTDGTYNAEIPTEMADRRSFYFPTSVIRQIGNGSIRMMADKEPERFDALERVGFRVERYMDVQHHLLERRGGHYLDLGGSAKISKGLIKIKSDAHPISYTPTGLLFDDGNVLDADIIVFATGFEGNLREDATRIVGPEIGERLDDFFHVDKEGEVIGGWKPMDHPGIWYTGGTIGHARFFSRFLALQIKADVEGVEWERYLDTPAV